MSINETYFPALMDILQQDPSATGKLNLECPICRDVMTTNDEDKVSYSNDEADVNHGAFVLPCGHIIGYSCSREIYNYSSETGVPHRCPTCRLDLIHTSCQHSHNIGTMLRVGEAQRHSMRLSVENSSRLFDYCVECCLSVILAQLRGIAMTECDLSSVLTGRRILGLTIHRGNIEWRSEGHLRDITLVTNLPVFDALKSTYAALGRFLGGLLNLPADEPADFECCLNLYEGGPGEDTESYLQMQDVMVHSTELKLMGMSPATRNATAHDDARSFCSLLETGALSQLLTRARLARQMLMQRGILDLN
ncbi:hypothetical protein FGRMN_521 [Fusarium graminum]|nr:hypothetical protein FGRMN_521 [Fusarium graminum]